MEPSTIQELDEWMTANCYNDSYGIGNRNIHEGMGLDIIGSLFVWYYTERGQRKYLNYFQTEKEAVAFAFDQIKSDPFASRHMIGFLKDKCQEQELLAELDNRQIGYKTDRIPYGGINDQRCRVFVFGCDIRRALDLKEKYFPESR